MLTQPNPDLEYAQLLRLFGECIDELKGFTPSDQRLRAVYGLAAKMFFHAASLVWLARGTDLGKIGVRPGTIVDHTSMNVLARAALETYLTFYYIYKDPGGEDEFEFRYCSWQLSGFAIRELIAPSLPENQVLQTDQIETNNQLRNRIRQTRAFLGLRAKQQGNVLQGKLWRLVSWEEIARLAGIGGEFARQVYHLLSAHAHADGLGAAQVESATAGRKQVEATMLSLTLVKAVLSKMILDYVGLFPQARAVLARDPGTERLATIWAGGLCADISQQVEALRSNTDR